MRVNLLVIHHIVLMIGERAKNRREVQGRDTQVLQVIQLLRDTLQIAAEKLARARLGMRTRSLTPGARDYRLTVTIVFATTHVIGRVAIIKAVREYLVKDALLHPGGILVVCQDFEISGVGWRVARDACGREPVAAVAGIYKKTVVGARRVQLQFN